MPLSSSYWSISLLPRMANFLEKSTSLLNVLVRPPYPSSTETLTSRLPKMTESYLSHFLTTNPSKSFHPEGWLSLGSLLTVSLHHLQLNFKVLESFFLLITYHGQFLYIPSIFVKLNQTEVLHSLSFLVLLLRTE